MADHSESAVGPSGPPPPPPAAMLPPPPPPPGSSRAPGVALALRTSDVFCYAMSHRPLVRGLAITNVGIDREGDELLLTVAVEAPTSQPVLHPITVAVELPEI